MEKIVIKNVGTPFDELKECLVVRKCDDGYWFYGSYENVTTAIEVCGTIGNGIILHKDWCKNEELKVNLPEDLSPMLKQFLDLKKKHPDALLLFRTGDFYETYMKDAEDASKILGITLTKSSKTKDPDGKPLAMAGFPYHALDIYLRKFIRAGRRVAICDQLEAPKTIKKRCITDLPRPNKSEI